MRNRRIRNNARQRRSHSICPFRALNAVSQICAALEYAHGQGYVHRDIKPANIFINQQGILKVGDFGLAKLIEGDTPHPEIREQPALTQTGVSMGTPDYCAPEQLTGGDVDQRADIYSLGVMFYEMLTRELPRGNFPPPSKKVQVDVRIDDVVLRAMESSPEYRYSNAGEMRTEVDVVRTGVVSGSPQAPGKAEASSGKTMLRMGLMALGGIGLCLLVWAGFTFLGKDEGLEVAERISEEAQTETKLSSRENRFGLPAFHGELLPISGTAGWRTEKPGKVFALPLMKNVRNLPSHAAIPVELGNVVSISTKGSEVVAVILEDGTVRLWGDPSYEVVDTFPGVQDRLSRVVAISVSTAFGIALHENGTVTAWPESNRVVAQLRDAGLKQGVSVCANRSFGLMVVSSDGKLHRFRNPDSRLEIPLIDDVRAVLSASDRRIVVLRKDGTVSDFATDSSLNFMTGFPDDLPPIHYMTEARTAMLKDGTVVTWGEGAFQNGILTPNAASLGSTDVGSARLPGNRWVFQDSNFVNKLFIEEAAQGFTMFNKFGPGWILGVKPETEEPHSPVTKADRYALPGFHGELRPIPGTAGWRSEKPGEIVGFTLNPNPSRAFEIPAGLTDVISIITRDTRAFAIRENGSVRAWPVNRPEASSVPGLEEFVKLQGELQDVVAIDNGIALHRGGTVSAWPPLSQAAIAVKKANLSEVICVCSANGKTLMAVTADGVLHGFGEHAERIPQLTDVRAVIESDSQLLVLHRDDSLSSYRISPDEKPHGFAHFPKNLPGRVKAICTGNNILLENGTAIRWGSGPLWEATEMGRTFDMLGAVGSGLFAGRTEGNQWTIWRGQSYTKESKTAEGLSLIAYGGGEGWIFGIRPRVEPGSPDNIRYGLPEFHGELRPIRGTAGWRVKEPGAAVPIALLPDPEDRHIIDRMPSNLSNVISLYTEWNIGIAIHADGAVTAWGGDQETHSRVLPARSGLPIDLADVVALDLNQQLGIALHRNGAITGWPKDEPPVRELTYRNIQKAVSVCTLSGGFLVVTSDGKLHKIGKLMGNRDKIPDLEDLRAVINRDGHVLALHQDGRLTPIEYKKVGNDLLKVPSDVPPVWAIGQANAAILDNRTVIGWDQNGRGELLIDIETELTSGRLAKFSDNRWRLLNPNQPDRTFSETALDGHSLAIQVSGGWAIGIRPDDGSTTDKSTSK